MKHVYYKVPEPGEYWQLRAELCAGLKSFDGGAPKVRVTSVIDEVVTYQSEEKQIFHLDAREFYKTHEFHHGPWMEVNSKTKEVTIVDDFSGAGKSLAMEVLDLLRGIANGKAKT